MSTRNPNPNTAASASTDPSLRVPSPHPPPTPPPRPSSVSSHFSWATENFMDGTFAETDSVRSDDNLHRRDHGQDLRQELQQQGQQLEALREENNRLRRMLIVANARGWQHKAHRLSHSFYDPQSELDVPRNRTQHPLGRRMRPRNDLADVLRASAPAREQGWGEASLRPRQVYPPVGSHPSLFAGFDVLDGSLRPEPRHGESTVGVFSYAMAGLGVASIAVTVAWGLGLVGREK